MTSHPEPENQDVPKDTPKDATSASAGGAGAGKGTGNAAKGGSGDAGKPKRKGEGESASSESTIQFLKETWAEFRKISWPDRKQVIRETYSVLVLVTLITVMVLAFDYGVGKAIFEPLDKFARKYNTPVASETAVPVPNGMPIEMPMEPSPTQPAPTGASPDSPNPSSGPSSSPGSSPAPATTPVEKSESSK